MDNRIPASTEILHNRVPNRIRFAVPLIKNKRTLAELLKQSLLKDGRAKGIYHAEPNIVTGTLLVKFHPAFHSEPDVIELVRSTVDQVAGGQIEISQKHKNPRLGKMPPGAFFTRELVVSIIGNVLAGLLLVAFVGK
jgi:hypothetical protein